MTDYIYVYFHFDSSNTLNKFVKIINNINKIIRIIGIKMKYILFMFVYRDAQNSFLTLWSMIKNHVRCILLALSFFFNQNEIDLYH